MIYKYFSFSISIVFISFMVGMVMTALFRNTNFYREKLSNLNFIQSEAINKMMGVGVVQWIIKHTFFKYLNQKLKFDRKMNLSDIKHIRAEMTKAEIDHLFAFIFVLIFVFVALYEQKYMQSIVMLFVNVMMNLHPSLLQQQNKRRIDRLISKFEK